MKVRFKKLHPDAVRPQYAKPGDAGLDFTAISKSWDPEGSGCLVYETGIAVEIPEGHVGLLFPRSSVVKQPFMLKNCVGVIDSGYRGAIKFFYHPTDRPRKCWEAGDRVGQMIIIPYPQVELEEAEELSESVRGDTGWGSSGR